MRLSHLVAAAVLAMTSCAFAVDKGYGVAGLGPTAHVTTSLNRSIDTYNVTPGFSGTRYNAGKGVAVTQQHETNPTISAVEAQATVMPIAGGRGYSTVSILPGRNDPMPIIGGRRTATNLGGTGE